MHFNNHAKCILQRNHLEKIAVTCYLAKGFLIHVAQLMLFSLVEWKTRVILLFPNISMWLTPCVWTTILDVVLVKVSGHVFLLDRIFSYCSVDSIFASSHIFSLTWHKLWLPFFKSRIVRISILRKQKGIGLVEILYLVSQFLYLFSLSLCWIGYV